MTNTYKTQAGNVYSFDASFNVYLDGVYIGTAHSATGAHCIIVSSLMRTYAKKGTK